MSGADDLRSCFHFSSIMDSNLPATVTPVSALSEQVVRAFFSAHGLVVVFVPENEEIPGSYWGESEAGLIGHQLYLRADTPVHSALHEACHFICMDDARRQALHRDAGGSDTEENAVCYLQCLLADELQGYSMRQCFADMDAWGYTFVLGSASAWFERDSDDAQVWLRGQGLLPIVIIRS